MFKPTGFIKTIALMLGLLITTASYASETSLYDRIGGEKGARAITEDIWNNHSKNPIVNNRFANSDPVYVKQKVFEIVAATTGGNVKYTGKDMLSTHASMNISDMEFNAVVDDVLKAFEMHGVKKKERDEVLAILWSVKDQIVNPKLTTRSLSPK